MFGDIALVIYLLRHSLYAFSQTTAISHSAFAKKEDEAPFHQMWTGILSRERSTILDALQLKYVEDMDGLIKSGKFEPKSVRRRVCRKEEELSELLVLCCKGSSFGDQVLQFGDTFICSPVNEFAGEWDGTCCRLFPTDFLFASHGFTHPHPPLKCRIKWNLFRPHSFHPWTT